MTRFGQNQSPDDARSGYYHCAAVRFPCCALTLWLSVLFWLATGFGWQTLPGLCQTVAPEVRSQKTLRVVWGGGSPQTWQGNIRFAECSVKIQAILGLESDAGASLSTAADTIQIHSVRAAEFGGADLVITGPESATVEIELRSTESPELRVQQSIPLAGILDATQGAGMRIRMDASGNVLDLRPAVDGALPVSIDRQHLVFSPGETFSFRLPGTPVPFSAGSTPKLTTRVTPARSDETLYEQSQEVLVDDNQRLTATDLAIDLPTDTGAYNIQLTLNDSSLTSRLGLGRDPVKRTMQVVVIDDQKGPEPPDREVALWREVQSTRNTENPWIARIPGLQPLRLSSTGKLQPDAGVQTIQHDGREFTELSPGGWQALPLRIEALGKPHIIEIEYLDQGPMALGISVLQPDESGRTGPFGVDSGITVPAVSEPGEPTLRRHQFIFWPRHNSPFLLFANRHAVQPSVIGTVRVLSGPNQLAAAANYASRPDNGRQYLSFYEQPLFVDNFAVSKRIDPETGFAIDDWQSWLDGARRWAEYLKASGHSGAMLVVMSEGSGLYPSPLIQPTPRHDNGMLASSPVDPIRKDVVELLLRVFAREGLQLVPVLDFNAPIPALEQLRTGPDSDNELPAMVLNNLAGESRLSTYRDTGTGSYYNPLNPRVQAATGEIVAELSARYCQHRSLGGVGLLLSRHSLPVIPGQSWGVDAATMQQFVWQHETDEFSQTPAADLANEILNGPGREAWLAWRQEQMGQWYARLRTNVQGSLPAGKLFLLATDLFETQDAFSALAPSLRRRSDIHNAASRIGLPLAAIGNDPHILYLRPHEVAPEKSLAATRLHYALNHSADNSVSAALPDDGVLFTHRYSWAHFEQLQQARPFGQPETHPIMRLQPLIAAEMWSRQPLAEGLLTGDPRYLVDGGWLTGFGREQATSAWIEAFTRLPAIRFSDVEPTAGSGTAATVVRQVVSDNQNWFYLLNPTPWELTVTLRLSGNHSLIQSLSGEDWLLDDDGTGLHLSLRLQPFDLRAGKTDASVSIAGYHEELESPVTSRLQEKLDWMISRVSLAERAEPIDRLVNPGFEPVADNENRFGWYYDQSSAESIALQGETPFAGQASLSITSSGAPVWIRSDEFPAPETGRLSISVQLRTSDPDRQPPLRISVQGSDGEQLYYRFGSVGETNQETRQIAGDWREFAVHFDDLPPGGNQPIRIGFDLMGAGHVEIDEVRIYDRWLDKQDSNALTQQLQIAGYQLTSGGNIDKCRRILEGYWPRFLQVWFAEPGDGTDPETPRSSRLPQPVSPNSGQLRQN